MVPDPPFPPSGCPDATVYWAGRTHQSLGWVVSAGPQLGWELGVERGGRGLGGEGKAFPKGSSVKALSADTQ